MRYSKEQLQSLIDTILKMFSDGISFHSDPVKANMLDTLHRTIKIIRSCDFDCDAFEKELKIITLLKDDNYDHAYTLYELLFNCEDIKLPLYINDLLSPIVKWRLTYCLGSQTVTTIAPETST